MLEAALGCDVRIHSQLLLLLLLQVWHQTGVQWCQSTIVTSQSHCHWVVSARVQRSRCTKDTSHSVYSDVATMHNTC